MGNYTNAKTGTTGKASMNRKLKVAAYDDFRAQL